jgi:hypothetical protein
MFLFLIDSFRSSAAVFLLNRNLPFLIHAFILKTKVLLSQVYVTLADVGFSFSPLIYLLPKILNYLAFQSFYYERT